MGDSLPANPITGGGTPPPQGQPDPNAMDPAEQAKIDASKKTLDETNRLLDYEKNFDQLTNQERAARSAFQQAQDQQGQVNAQKATGLGGGGAVNISPLQQNLDSILAQKRAATFSTTDPSVNDLYQGYMNQNNSNMNSLLDATVANNRQGQQYQDYITSAQNIVNQNAKKQADAETNAAKMKQEAAAASSSGLSVDPYAVKKKPLSGMTLNTNQVNQGSAQTAGNTNQTALQSNRI